MWTLRLLVVSYDCVYYVERGGMLSTRVMASFDFLGTVHAMQRQHTPGRELFMNGEIRDCTASPGVVRIYFLADSHVRRLREE